MTTAAVVLAAGRGVRLGGERPKPLVEFRGRPLVAWALDAALASGLDPVVLVVGHGADEVAAVAPPGVRVVHAERWADGISQSLVAALDALNGDADVTSVCVGLADQPRVGADAYRRLAASAASAASAAGEAGTAGKVGESGGAIAVATYAGRRGNPVLLARSVWPEARALTGDEGARQLMGTHPVVEVDCTGTGDPADVDTLDDLRAMADDESPGRPTESGH